MRAAFESAIESLGKLAEVTAPFDNPGFDIRNIESDGDDATVLGFAQELA